MSIPRRSAAAFLLGTVTVAGASHAQSPGVPAARAPVRRIGVAYDPGLERAGFAAPVVRVGVNGVTAWMVVDTGAALHTFASWFVEKAGIASDAALSDHVAGRDAVGERLPLRFLHGVVATLDGRAPWHVAIAAVADFPPEFERARVAGLLSPQLLAGEAEAVLLDLRVPEIRIDATERAFASVRAGTHIRLEPCGAPGAKVPNQLFAADVAIGERTVRMLVDSGAERTQLATDATAAVGLPRDTVHQQVGVGGVAEQVAVGAAMPVALGGATQAIDVAIGGSRPGCDGEGLLGIDFLRQCRLALAADRGAIACGPR